MESKRNIQTYDIKPSLLDIGTVTASFLLHSTMHDHVYISITAIIKSMETMHITTAPVAAGVFLKEKPGIIILI